MNSLAFPDYAVIAAFFAVMIGVGVYYSRKSKSSDQFFENDRTVPWWLSGVSFYWRRVWMDGLLNKEVRHEG